MRLALAAVPEGIEIESVRAYLAGLSGATELHDLHVWGMSTTETALTAHLVMPQGHPGDAFLADVCTRLQHDYRIGHATIQIETDPERACALAPDSVV